MRACRNHIRLGLIAALGAALPLIARAYELIVPFTDDPTAGAAGPADYIKTIYTYSLGFGALLAMAMIVIGAIQYTLSEAIPSKEDARGRILNAIWGLVLLLSATLILQTINPDLTTLKELKLEPVPIDESPAGIPSEQTCDFEGEERETGPIFAGGPVVIEECKDGQWEIIGSVGDDDPSDALESFLGNTDYAGYCGDKKIQKPNQDGFSEQCDAGDAAFPIQDGCNAGFLCASCMCIFDAGENL